MSKKLIGAAALLCAAALTASACSAPQKKSDSTPSTGASSATSSSSSSASTGGGSGPAGSLTVLWNQYFYALNSATAFGNNVTNSVISYSTGAAAWYYDKDLQKVKDESFAKYEKVSDSPLTIKETLADTATWSDGVPVQACDMILAYGAQSTLFNTAEGSSDENTGKVDQKGGVYFDSSSEAWKLIKDFPTVGDNGKSVTYKYSEPYGDWEYALFSNGAGIPAHIIGKKALGAADDQAGCDAVTKAFQTKDKAALSKIAAMWNNDYNFTAMPKDPSLLVTDGPYVIKDIKDKQSLTMTANPEYKGSRVPKIKDITVVYNEDPTASAQALKNGEVAIIEPQATADLLKSLQGDDKITVLTGTTGTYEHVDLQMKNGGPFDPAKYGGDAEKAKKVREAFLLTIPRQQIIDTLIKPLNPSAEIRNSFNVTPGAPAYEATVKGNGMADIYAKVDIEKAKQLLQEAGATNVKVRLMYAKTNPRRQQEYALIAASAKQAGIEVINSGDPDWSAKLGQPNTYDASLFGWASSNDAVSGAAANFVPKGQNNFGNYNNPQMATWYKEMNGLTDKAKQDELNIKIEKQLVDDAFGIVIFQFPNVDAYDKTKVKNVASMQFVPNYFWNIWEWELVG